MTRIVLRIGVEVYLEERPVRLKYKCKGMACYLKGQGIRDEPAPLQAGTWFKYKGVGPPGAFVIRPGSYLVWGATVIFRGKVSLEKIRNNLLLSNYFCLVDCCPGVNLCSNFYFGSHLW